MLKNFRRHFCCVAYVCRGLSFSHSLSLDALCVLTLVSFTAVHSFSAFVSQVQFLSQRFTQCFSVSWIQFLSKHCFHSMTVCVMPSGASWESSCPRFWTSPCPPSGSSLTSWTRLTCQTSATSALFTRPARGRACCPPPVTPPTSCCPSCCPRTNLSSTGSREGAPVSASWMTR